jgi:hypothetical protein
VKFLVIQTAFLGDVTEVGREAVAILTRHTECFQVPDRTLVRYLPVLQQSLGRDFNERRRGDRTGRRH